MVTHKFKGYRRILAVSLISVTVLAGSVGALLFAPKADVANACVRSKFSIRSSNGRAYEQGRQVDYINFTRTGNTSKTEIINLSFEGSTTGTADYPDDYRLVLSEISKPDGTSMTQGKDIWSVMSRDNSQLTFPAGASRIVIHLTPIDDTVPEETGTVRITIAPATTTPYSVTQPSFATTDIYDNDGDIVTIRAVDDEATETIGNTGLFRVSRSHQNIALPLTINTKLTGTASYLLPSGKIVDASVRDLDVSVPATPSLVIPANKREIDIIVTAVDDTLEESDETVILSLLVGNGYQLARNARDQQATITITDSDSTEVVINSFGVAGATGTNGFSIMRLGDTTKPLSVKFAASGTAIRNDDYHLWIDGGRSTANTVTMGAGSSSYAISIEIEWGSAESSLGKTITLTLQQESGYRLGTPSESTQIIGGRELSLQKPKGFIQRVAEKLIPVAHAAEECDSSITVQWKRYGWRGTTLEFLPPQPLPNVPVQITCSNEGTNTVVALTGADGKIALPPTELPTCEFPIATELVGATVAGTKTEHFVFERTSVSLTETAPSATLTGILPTTSGRITKGETPPAVAREVCVSPNDAIITKLLGDNKLQQSDLNECGTTKELVTSVEGVTADFLKATTNTAGFYTVAISNRDISKYPGADWQTSVIQCLDAFHTFQTNPLTINPKEGNRNDAQEIANPNK